MSINTTAIYTHVTPRKERERLGRYLGEQGGQRKRATHNTAHPAARDAGGRWLKNTAGGPR